MAPGQSASRPDRQRGVARRKRFLDRFVDQPLVVLFGTGCRRYLARGLRFAAGIVGEFHSVPLWIADAVRPGPPEIRSVAVSQHELNGTCLASPTVRRRNGPP